MLRHLAGCGRQHLGCRRRSSRRHIRARHLSARYLRPRHPSARHLRGAYRSRRRHLRYRYLWRPSGRGRRPGQLQPPLDPVQAGGIPADPRCPRQQHPGADQLQMEPRRGRAGHLGQPGVDDIGRPRQGSGSEGSLLQPHPVELVGGDPAQHRRGPLGGRGDDDEVAEPLEQILDEAPRIVTGLDDPVDLAEDAGAVPGSKRVHGRVEQLRVGEPEQRRGTVIRQTLRTRPGDELVEHGQRVTHRPTAGPDDEGEHPRRDRHALGVADLLQIAGQPGRRDEPERVVVGPGADRPDDLLRLGCREDELHMLRRLLDDLQQGVEALRGDHVGLVDDVDLVATLRWTV